jgi:HEPN domain-containing protein
MKNEVKDWYHFADKDIIGAEDLITDPDVTTLVAFHCQQAVEKYIKAYLIEHDVPLVKIHDLVKLYGMVKNIKDLELNETVLSQINKVYVDERYPGALGILPDGEPSMEEVKEFLDFAKAVAAKIKAEIV